MNKYQSFIRKVEEQYKKDTVKYFGAYLCQSAYNVYKKHREFDWELIRFQGEIYNYTAKDDSLSCYLHRIMDYRVFLDSYDIMEYKLLILHRMYQDAEYDYWSE
jgi:hypothetical protein